MCLDCKIEIWVRVQYMRIKKYIHKKLKPGYYKALQPSSRKLQRSPEYIYIQTKTFVFNTLIWFNKIVLLPDAAKSHLFNSNKSYCYLMVLNSKIKNTNVFHILYHIVLSTYRIPYTIPHCSFYVSFCLSSEVSK